MGLRFLEHLLILTHDPEARRGKCQIMEGPETFQRSVVIEFATLQAGVAAATQGGHGADAWRVCGWPGALRCGACGASDRNRTCIWRLGGARSIH